MLSTELAICALLITQLSGLVLGRDFFSEEYNAVIDEFDDGYFEKTKNNEDFSAAPELINQHSLHTNNPTIISNIENFETSHGDPKEDVLTRHKHHLDVLNKLRDVTSHLKDNLEIKYARNQFLKPERFKKSDPNVVQVTNYYKGSNPFDSENTADEFINRDMDLNEYNDYGDVIKLAEQKERKDLKKSSLDTPMMLVRNLLERNNVGLVEPIEYATSPIFPPCHHGRKTIPKQNKPYNFIEITEDQPNFETLTIAAQPKISRNGKDLSISNLFGNNTEFAINVKLKVDIDIPQLNDNFNPHKHIEKNTQSIGKLAKAAASDNSVEVFPSLITLPFPFFKLTEAFSSNTNNTNAKTSTHDKNQEFLNTLSKRNGVHKNKKVKLNAKVKHYKKKSNTKDNVVKQTHYDMTTSPSTVSPQNQSEKEIRENEIAISKENDRKNEVRQIKEVNSKRENVTLNEINFNKNLTVPLILWKKHKLINKTSHDQTTSFYSDTTQHISNNITENITSTDKVILRTNIMRRKRSVEQHQTVGNLTESDYYAAKNEQMINKTMSDDITDTVQTSTEIITIAETLTEIDKNEGTKSIKIKNIVNENKNEMKNKLKDSEKSFNKNKSILLEHGTELNESIHIENKTDSNEYIKEVIPKNNIWEIILDENQTAISFTNSDSLDKDLFNWTNRSNESRAKRNILIDGYTGKNASVVHQVDQGMFGEVDWSDVDAIAPAFMAFLGKYMTGALTLCSDITCHSIKCEHRQCLHRWCSSKERENKTGHCAPKKENKGNTESMTTLEEVDLPTKSVIAIVEMMESKIRDKLYGKITLCSSKNCITVLADGKQFHKFRCSRKKLDRKEHCIDAKKIFNS